MTVRATALGPPYSLGCWSSGQGQQEATTSLNGAVQEEGWLYLSPAPYAPWGKHMPLGNCNLLRTWARLHSSFPSAPTPFSKLALNIPCHSQWNFPISSYRILLTKCAVSSVTWAPHRVARVGLSAYFLSLPAGLRFPYPVDTCGYPNPGKNEVSDSSETWGYWPTLMTRNPR